MFSIWFGLICTLLPTSGPENHFTPLESDLDRDLSARFTFRHFDDEPALAGRSVRALTQDHRGYLWIGTDAGLVRYDGYRFRLFTQRIGHQSGLTENHILSLLIDSSERLWIGTLGGGLQCFDFATETFQTFRHDPADGDSLSDNTIWDMVEGRDGTLWLATYNGLNHFTPASGKAIRYKHNPEIADSLSDNRIWSLCLDRRGDLWVGTSGGGLCRFRVEDDSFEHFRHRPDLANSLGGDRVSTLLEDKAGRLWVGTFGDGVTRSPNGLNRYLPESGTFERCLGDPSGTGGQGHSWISDIVAGADGRLWVCTFGGGLYLYQPDTGRWASWTKTQSRFGLPDNRIWTLFKDRSGSYWIGSMSGLTQMRATAIQSIPFPEKQDQGMVQDFLKDSGGNLLVLTSDRFMAHDRSTGTWSNLLEDLQAELPDSPQFLCLAQTPDRSLWLGTMSGLFQIHPEGTTTHYHHRLDQSDSLSQDWVTCLLAGKSGGLWVGTAIGLNRFDPKTGRAQRIKTLRVQGEEASRHRIEALYEDALGNLWVGTMSHGLKWVPEGRTQLHAVPTSSAGENNLSHRRITAIAMDSEGFLWVGTKFGLNRFNPTTFEIEVFFQDQGLPDNQIEDLAWHHDVLWISTASGWAYRDPTTGRLINLASTMPLGPKPHFGRVYVDPSGIVYFGNRGGYAMLDPSRIPGDPPPAAPALTGFFLMNRPIQVNRPNEGVVLCRAISELDEMIVESRHGMLSFEFSAFHFIAPQQVRYAYRLDGFQQDWLYSEADNRRAAFTNLDPGEYRLFLKAASPMGHWSPPRQVLKLKVLPPWWMLWWVQVLMAACLIGLIFLWHRARVDRHLALERLRTRIAGDLHDEIGVLLSHIALNAETLRHFHARGKDVDQKADLIGNTAREVIDVFSDIIWAIDTRNDSFEQLSVRLQSTANRLLRANGIRCDLHCSNSLGHKSIRPLLRQHLFLICKEAMANVLRHSNADRVRIHLEQDARKVHLRIEDNGGGRSENPLAKGIHSNRNGLRNMRERVALLRGQLSIRQNPGFVIEIEIPR